MSEFKWISVKESKPEQMRLVLIAYEINMFGTDTQVAEMSLRIGDKFNRAIFLNDSFSYICKSDEEYEFKNVTHWMYWSDIPKPNEVKTFKQWHSYMWENYSSFMCNVVVGLGMGIFIFLLVIIATLFGARRI